jgi:hypothetical protein
MIQIKRLLLTVLLFGAILPVAFGQGAYTEMQKMINAVEECYSGFKLMPTSQQSLYLSAKKAALVSIGSCKNANEQLKVVKGYLSFFKNNHLCAFTGDFMSFAVNELGFKMDSPTLAAVDSTTVLLTVPSFLGSNNEKIDELLKTNHDMLQRTRNLIIDIRGNRGGNDACYYSIMPLLYTNDIVGDNGYVRASTRSIERYRDQFSEAKLDVMSKKKGELLPYTDGVSDFYVEKSSLKPMPNPVNVVIVADRYVGSSAEQFIIAAKQSRKVKVVGENTSGTLDCTNPEIFQFFNGTITVTIPTMVSSRVWNRAAIENVGLQPDIYAPDMANVVEFAKRMLSQW